MKDCRLPQVFEKSCIPHVLEKTLSSAKNIVFLRYLKKVVFCKQRTKSGLPQIEYDKSRIPQAFEKSHIPTPRHAPPASLQQQLALSPFPCTPSFNVVSRSVVRKVAKFLPFERPPFVPWPQNERVNIEVRGPGGLPDIGRHAPACYCVLVAKYLLSPVSLLGS